MQFLFWPRRHKLPTSGSAGSAKHRVLSLPPTSRPTEPSVFTIQSTSWPTQPCAFTVSVPIASNMLERGRSCDQSYDSNMQIGSTAHQIHFMINLDYTLYMAMRRSHTNQIPKLPRGASAHHPSGGEAAHAPRSTEPRVFTLQRLFGPSTPCVFTIQRMSWLTQPRVFHDLHPDSFSHARKRWKLCSKL